MSIKINQKEGTRKIWLSPSMMCADFLNLSEELETLKSLKIDYLHIDIMDGHYVPNYTLGPDLVKAMYEKSEIPLDFHLMVEDVDNNLSIFTAFEESIITFHPETSRHPVRTIQQVIDAGCQPSIAIDPAMSIETVKHLLPLVDMVCVMTVNPGYAGQKLIPFCIEKMAELDRWRKENKPQLKIEVDGNVSWENIPKMLKAGADVLVLGTSSVFTNTMTRKEAYSKLDELIKENS